MITTFFVQSATINAVLGYTKRAESIGTIAEAEYIEFFGSPGEDLGSLTLIVVESSNFTAREGEILRKFSLAGLTLGCNGRMVIGNDDAIGNFSSVNFSANLSDEDFVPNVFACKSWHNKLRDVVVIVICDRCSPSLMHLSVFLFSPLFVPIYRHDCLGDDCLPRW